MDLWPDIIPGDKANHFVRGAQIASVIAAVVMTAGYGWSLSWSLQPAPRALALCLAVAGISACVGAYIAGVLVEWLQSRENARALRSGGTITHAIERADVRWTAKGSIPVAAPLFLIAAVLAIA